MKTSEEVHNYIASLPIDTNLPGSESDGFLNSIDINELPNGIVTGSNMIQFPKDASPEIKSSVALSLLAAQRVATNDAKINSPAEWLEQHNSVLKNLNWLVEGGGSVTSHFKSFDVAVHEAIIPFLTAAFGNVAGAGALIISALNQLKDMDKKSSWITLFDKQSRRFNVTEYMFSVVDVVGDTVRLKLAAARFDGSFGKTQVLFFDVKNQNATFEQAHQSYAADLNSLARMNAALKEKMITITKSFIQSLPDELLLGAGETADEMMDEKLPD